MIKKVFLPILAFIAVIMSFGTAYAIEINDGETLKFDFGEKDEEDWIAVNASDMYNVEKGYGFDMTSFVKNASASGTGIGSDCVEFQPVNGHFSSFNVDIPDGIYKLKFLAGDIDTINITAEEHLILLNMMFNGCAAEAEIPVSDGQLNITVSSFKYNVPLTLSALEITRMSSLENRRTRVFIGGDSLAAQYYPSDLPSPLEQGYQGGWGQMLPLYIPDDLYVMNLSSGGQTAEGFLESGQFESAEFFMREGDYFIISFGVNDSEISDRDKFKKALSEMVSRTKAKGAVPIIMTETCKLTDFNETAYSDGRWFRDTALEVCSELNCNYADIQKNAAAYFTAIGKDSTKELYWKNWSGEQDNLHYSREGAGHIARLIAEELIRQGIWRFDGKIPDYGVSDDVLLKCSGVYSGNKLNLQNLAPYAREVQLLINTYNQYGAVTGNKMLTVRLMPYDVLQPDRITDITLDKTNNCKAYIINNSIKSINETPQTRNFGTVYNIARQLFN